MFICSSFFWYISRPASVLRCCCCLFGVGDERISRNLFCSPILPPALRTMLTRMRERPWLPRTAGDKVNSSLDGVLLPAAGGVAWHLGSRGVRGALFEDGVVGFKLVASAV